jgi:hypothetical protein
MLTFVELVVVFCILFRGRHTDSSLLCSSLFSCRNLDGHKYVLRLKNYYCSLNIYIGVVLHGAAEPQCKNTHKKHVTK